MSTVNFNALHTANPTAHPTCKDLVPMYGPVDRRWAERFRGAGFAETAWIKCLQYASFVIAHKSIITLVTHWACTMYILRSYTICVGSKSQNHPLQDWTTVVFTAKICETVERKFTAD